MNSELRKVVDQIVEKKEFRCPVCGSARYVTDQGNFEVTFHCSSREARFWEFDRGSEEQKNAKRHWEQSKWELLLGPEDANNIAAAIEAKLGPLSN